MNLPSPIHRYFDADARSDGDGLIQAFSPDAVVQDEAASHIGRKAIQTWWRTTKSRYQQVMEPLELAEQGGITSVRTKVSGTFSGSPITLTFAFRLEADQIKELQICA